MDPVDIALLVASVALALASRGMMKRRARLRLGRANGPLLEIDYWRATSGEALSRCVLLVELASWAAIALLVAKVALVTMA
jgi:hypothetical protein